MKPKTLWLTVAILLPAVLSSTAYPFDSGHFAMNSPLSRETGDVVLGLNHAFGSKLWNNGKLEKNLDTKGYGFKSANAGVDVRYSPLAFWGVKGFTSSRLSEYGAGLFGAHAFSVVSVGASIEVSRFRDGEANKVSSYSSAHMDSEALRDFHLVPAVGVGYDWYHKHSAVAVGLGIPFSEEHALLGAYHARLTKRDIRNADIGSHDSWSVGYRWNSGGHQFFLLMSNSDGITERQVNLGAKNDNPNWAFRITRKI